MPIRVSNIRLGIEESEAALPQRLAGLLSVKPGDVLSWRILRKSLDARDPLDLAFVYSVEARLVEREAEAIERINRRQRPQRADWYKEVPFRLPEPGQESLTHQPVIVGSGPGGLAAAYFLAEAGYQPLLLERGAPVSQRIRDVAAFDAGGPHQPESNYLFGEGGAGTFSDGKLTYRGSGPEVRRILEMYAECKGKPSIVYEHRPHLGSNRLPAVVKAQRQRIEAMGGTMRFHCRVEDLDLADGRVRGLATSSGYIPAEVVILAIGHSARDTYRMLLQRGVPLAPKAFQLGLRIEQPQESINRHCYGAQRLEDRLGAAQYAIVAKGGGMDVFSFCMCAGGYIMPSVSTPEAFCTNGMSLSKHDSPFANSGLVATLEPARFGSDHPLAGMMLQEELERRAFTLGRRNYLCPIQWAKDFLAERLSRGVLPSSYPRGVVPSDLREVLPSEVARAMHLALPIMDRKWRGRFLEQATLVGPETRGSAPVRILRRDETRTSPDWEGLYPVGEGAGYAGGIVSAAVDGLRSALAIIQRYAPLRKT